jgi:Zn-dependent peptidase ImmA (M78 family)
VLIHLANALGVKVEFFFRPETAQVTLSKSAYRRRASASAKFLQSAHAQAKEKLEKYLEIESLFPPNRFARFKLPAEEKRTIRRMDDVESVALVLRKQWSIGLSPIENLMEVLEDRGVKIVMLEGEDDFDGLSCWANDDIPVVVIKKDLPGDRQRSNLAHELGHLILKVSSSLNEEKAALRFSGAFLVPEDVVYQELGKQRHTLDILELNMLKRKFGMSMQQWIYRAKDLSIISESRAVELFKLFRSRGWRVTEPGYEVPSEKPERFERLVLQAVTEKLISPVRAAEVLGKPYSEFRKDLQAEFAGKETPS